ncbi:MAG: ParB N-terminal domain-containing protein [Myxococcaceae bacterium]
MHSPDEQNLAVAAIADPVAETTEQTVSDAPAAARARSQGAPALIALDRIVDDRSFQLRPEGDLRLLATDIARLGQLFPVELRLHPHGFQVIAGFRRLAALKFLQRDRVLARLHTDLSDEDALLLALASVIHRQPMTREALVAVRDRLESEGRLGVAARDMLDKALAPDDELGPEGPVEEVDADELALAVTQRIANLNQDLSLLADVFGSLEPERREALLEQLRYSADLVQFLEGK